MKKVLFILTLSMIFSCNRNLLDATKTPEKTNLDNVGSFEYKHVDVKPEVAPEGVVFGGYIHRFIFNKNWYVLAKRIMRYDSQNKKIEQIGSNAILRIDDDKTITIYAKNLPYEDSSPYLNVNEHGKFLNNVWYNFTVNNEILSMQDGMIYNEYGWDHNYKYKINYSRRTVNSGDLATYGPNEVEAYWPSSMTIERNGRGKTYTKDLVNWTTEYRYGETWTPIHFPSPTFNFNEDGYPPDNNFQGRAGVVWPAVVHFKGYIYVLGGYNLGRDKIDKSHKKTYDLALEYYYRLDVNKNGSVAGNWEHRTVPFGRRASMLVRINEEEGKMYINDGVSAKMEIDPFAVDNDDKVDYSFKRDYRNNIWSTSDGIKWSRDSQANWDNASYVDYENGSQYIGPDPGPAFPKSDIAPTGMFYPDYTELNGLYYTIDFVPVDAYLFNDVRPVIWNAIYSDKTNYILSEKDIKHSDEVRLYVSKVKPSNSLKNDWSRLPSIAIFTSSIWMSGSKMLFNLNGKLVRLVDYSVTLDEEISYYAYLANYYSIQHNMYYNQFLSDKTIVASTKLFHAMENKYYADMYNYYATNMIKYYMPDKAITHYSIDLSAVE